MLRHDAKRFGGYVIETRVTPIEGEQLANDFSQEIVVKAEFVASAEGDIELSAYREQGAFRRIVVNASTSSARREPRFTMAQIRRLAMDVKAKVQARASSIDAATRKVTVTIYPRGAGFDIDVTVSYR